MVQRATRSDGDVVLTVPSRRSKLWLALLLGGTIPMGIAIAYFLMARDVGGAGRLMGWILAAFWVWVSWMAFTSPSMRLVVTPQKGIHGPNGFLAFTDVTGLSIDASPGGETVDALRGGEKHRLVVAKDKQELKELREALYELGMHRQQGW